VLPGSYNEKVGIAGQLHKQAAGMSLAKQKLPRVIPLHLIQKARHEVATG